MKRNFDFQSLTLRPVTKGDKRFVRDLYCTSRDHEINHVDMPEPQLKVFLRQQFALQQKHFDKTYPKADKQVIIDQGKPIGRLYVEQSADDIHLIDITLLREYRGNGIGRYFVEQLIAKALQKKTKVSLYVQAQNPALKLYQSMGFKPAGGKGDYFYMEINS